MTAKKKKEKVAISPRPVIVAVMGHVDHGKTTFLDAVRGTKVQEGEVGGITQNTRAHEVVFKDQKITFIDTPGHEAFSEMRSRGAHVTDIVVLVVAADDGVLPQTKESIKFAKKAGVPIIVAINKIDLPGADPAKIKNQLSQNDVLVEEYGGDTQVFEISALKKEGLDELLEGIVLLSEIMEIQKTKVEIGIGDAIVLESKLDNKLGAVALVLIKSGAIKVGDVAITDCQYSNVRAILDEYQNNIPNASESAPVWIVGIDNVLPTGSIVYFSENEKEAKEIIKDIKNNTKVEKIADKGAEVEEVDDLSLLTSMLASEQKNEDIKKLYVVVRADSQGTLEVVLSELKKLNDDEVTVIILSSGTGNITRKDVLTAKNSHGIVLGFQVVVPSDLAAIVQQEKVLVRIYGIIYELIDEVSDAMESLLEPEMVEEEVARAHIKQVFVLSDGTKVAGCEVVKGIVVKGYKIWVERKGGDIGRGRISSLKRNKDEVKEVQKGIDCGIFLDPQFDIEEGDDIVLYKVEKN